MFKRKLFKHALPMILSVAMVFQSMPATAMAAEYEETETVVEQAAETETSVSGENQNEEVEVAESVQESTPKEADTVCTTEVQTQTTEESEGTATEASVENNDVENAGTEAAEEVQNNADNAADVEVQEAEIIINSVDGGKYDNNNEEWTVTAIYKQKQQNPFKSLVDNLKGSMVYIRDDNGYNNALTSNLVFTWQKGTQSEDGTYSYVETSEAPQAAGTYRLAISIDEKLAKAETKYINFVIEKAELTIKVNADTSSLSGKTVSEIKALLAEELSVSTNNRETEADYLTYLNAQDASVFTIRKAGDETKTALEDAYQLKKGDDIVIETKAALKDSFQNNYELKQYTENVSVTELKAVTMTAEPNLEEGKDITYTYSGSDITAPTIVYSESDDNAEGVIVVKVTVDDELDEATGEAKTLTVTDENITTVWLDANKNELGEGVLPQNAGVYYYQIAYTDKNGVYAETTDKVKVVIEPVKLIVRPELSEKTSYNVGSSVKELLGNVTYKLYQEDNTEFTSIADTFWGVSYNQDNLPQYYEPVFAVQMRTNITVKTSSGEETTTEGTWTTVTTFEEPSGTTSETDETTKTTTTTTVEYRLIFTGEKAVYINGNVIDSTLIDINKQIDVNSAETNYTVNTAKAADAANIITDIEVKNSTKVTIDTSDITSGITITDGVYTKIYDGSGFFENRSAYKKAKTDNSEANNADNFSYIWYNYTLQEKMNDEGEVEKDADGNTIYEPVCGNRVISTSYDLHELTNAGRYCLKITYKDTTNTYTADPAYLYFNVEQQLVKLAPKAEALTAYTSNTIGDFIEKISAAETSDYSILAVKDNKWGADEDVTQDLTQEWNELNNRLEDGFYEIQWVVLKGDNTDKDKAVYTEINDIWDESFDANISYKLGVRLDWVNSNNYTNEYECGENNQIQSGSYYTTLDITVKESANKELEVVFDDTKLNKEEKTYNGEAQFDINKLIESGYITIRVKDTDESVALIGENALPVVFIWENDNNDEKTTNDAGLVNAGTYKLIVNYPGDETYGGVYEETDYDFVINPAKLIVDITPALQQDNIVAGLDMSETDRYDGDVVSLINYNYDAIAVTGCIEADKAAFEGGIYSDAFNQYFYPVVSDAEGNRYTGYLRYKDSYTLTLNSLRLINGESLKDGYADNYELVIKDADFTVGKRGTSSVEYAESDNYGMAVKYDYSQNPITVKPADGVHYFYEDDLGIGEEFIPGNYFVFDIVAPKEFKENTGSYAAKYYRNFVYQNSIENDGKGYVIQKAGANGTIRVAFPVTKADKADARAFTIVWEELDGEIYKEAFTVDFSSAQLEDDLRSAVAPKSLAFNGVNTKMTVGEKQQLDVKLTKVLNSDVVYLNYEVTDGKEFLSVTEKTGIVTALKKGSATVAVYPVKYNGEKGEFERLDFKPVTTKITVSDVTAPKISSVYAYDYSFDVTYTKPSDGYRREIYVLEGKNVKPDVFETAITNAKKGNSYAETFAAYRILTKEYEISTNKNQNKYYNSKTNAVTLTMGENSKIEPNKEYTVYVRNVSGTRTLDDNSFVELSATGTTKAFKSTAILPLEMRLYYDSEQEAAKLTAEEEKLNPEGCDEIALSQGSIQLKAMGLYKSSADGAEDSSYEVDYEWKKLPVGKTETNYAAQKLTFYALDSTRGYTKEQLAVNKDLAKTYKVLIGDRYYKASSIAKIDKNGKLTLTGIGYVYICAYDSVSKELAWSSNYDTFEVSGDEMYQLRITTSVTGIQAKSITLKAGSAASIYNSLTFLGGEKNKKLASNLTSQVGIYVESDNDAVWFDYDAKAVVAEKANVKANLTVTLEDNPEVQTTLQVNTKAMDAVKSLKASEVLDHRAVVAFSHTSNWPDAFLFRIELTDNRNRLISSEMISPWDMLDWEKTDGKNYWYTYEFDNLKRQSVYNVTVTPVYSDGTEAAKAAKTKFTTINIPASEENLDKDDFGGMDIRIDGTSNYLGSIGYLTSGNTYTLIAEADETAKNRKTDTLTWKSSNSKVASIKANVGTYTAALKATGVGATTIEVTSKLTKKVIARYIVRVKSVSNGGENAYGDTEPKEQVYWDDDYNLGIEVLTEANPVSFDATWYDYRWVSFTAPADGKYAFGRTNAICEGYYYKDSYTSETISSKELKEGETIYLKVSGNSRQISKTVTVRISRSEKYGKLTASGSVNAGDYARITFTAPADNYYTFYASESGKSAVMKKGTSTAILYFALEGDEVSIRNSVGLTKGQEVVLTEFSSGNYTIWAEGRDYNSLTSTAVSTGDLKQGDEKWYSFEAAVTGYYTIALGETNEKVAAEYYRGLTSASRSGVITNNSVKLALSKGDKIAVRVYTESEEAVNTTISVSTPEFISLTDTKEITVPKNGEIWLSYALTEAGEYGFSYDKDTVAASYCLGEMMDEVSLTTNGDAAYYVCSKADAGKTLYIKLTASDADNDVTVTVTAAKTEAKSVSDAAEVSADSKTFYEYTASEYGLYTFTGTAAAAEGETAKSITSKIYTKAQQSNNYGSIFAGIQTTAAGFYAERMLAAGEKIIFSVEESSSNTSEAKTTANVAVSKVDVNSLSGDELSLAAGESKWFKYTAAAADEYKLSWNADTAASVYYSASLSANINSSLTNGDIQTLSAGDTLYLKVTNNAAEATKIKFTVASAAVPLPEGEFEVKANESVTYKYTVTEAGRYNISYTGASEDANVRINYSDSRSRVSDTILASGTEVVFDTVGKTIRFTVETDKDVKLTIKLEKIVPSEAGEASVEKGKAQWFKVTIPVTGRYTVAVTDKDGKTLENAEAEYVTDMLSLYSDDLSVLNENWLEKDAVYYVRVKNNADAAQSVKVAFNKIDAEAITLGTPVEVTLKEGEVKYYSFKTTEAGVYTFTIENESGATLEYFDGTSNGKNTLLAGSVKVPYGIDELIKITGAGEGAKVKLTIVKAESYTLEAGKNLQVTLADEANAYISFKAPKAGWYAFYLKDIPEGVDAYIWDNYNINLNNNTVYGYTYLALNEEKDFGLAIGFSSETENETKTVTFYAEEIVPEELTSELSVNVEKGVYKWVTFTAPEDGRYVFDDDSTAVKAKYRYTYTTVNTGGSSGYLPYEKNLTEGTKVTLAVYYNEKADTAEGNVPDSAEFKLSVKKIEPTVIDNTKETSQLTIPANTTAWYSYTAAKAGDYSFAFTEGESYKYVYLYSSMADVSYNSYGHNLSRIMSANNTVYFKISNDSSLEITVTLNVTIDEAQTLSEGENTLTLGAAGEHYYLFQPSATHNYKITVKHDSAIYSSGSYVKWYTGSVDNNNYSSLYAFSEGGRYTRTLNKYLDASTEYYLYINNNAAATVTVTVEKCDKEITAYPDEYGIDSDIHEGETIYYKYTADYAGTYRFRIEGADADLLDSNKNSLGLTNESSSTYYSQYTYYLSEKETVYVKAYCKDGEAGYAYLYLSLKSMDNATVISNMDGETVTVTTDNNNEIERMYQISPSESGIYTFEFNGATNGYAYLYNEYYPNGFFYELYFKENNSLRIFMRDDCTYYLKIIAYEVSDAFSFKINRGDTEELSENKTVSFSLADEERMYYCFTPEVSGLYTFTFNGLDEKEYLYMHMYNYDEENREISQDNTKVIYGLNAGTKYFVYIAAEGQADFELTVNRSLTETITVNHSVLAEIESGAVAMYKFTAPSTGTYSFYTTIAENSSSSDSYGYLYDDKFNLIAENDDGSDLNFLITYPMTAGETVYLAVRELSRNAINCYVHVIEGK